jgi:hypothetical protein
LSPLPCWSGLTDEEIQQRIAKMVSDIEEETAQMHRDKGTSPLGVKRVLGLNPHDFPKEMKGSPAPQFIAASRETMRALREAYKMFVTAYRDAADRLRAGKLDVIFPRNSFPPPRPFVQSFAPG